MCDNKIECECNNVELTSNQWVFRTVVNSAFRLAILGCWFCVCNAAYEEFGLINGLGIVGALFIIKHERT